MMDGGFISLPTRRDNGRCGKCQVKEEKLQVTRKGGFTGFESSDRKLLYYAKTAADPDLWKLQLENREESPVSPRVHVS
jgi:hypothetical protein